MHYDLHCNVFFLYSGWLSPADDPQGYVQRIDRRIEDITGLTMSTAEQLQVVNYGIGGHYEPHYDFAQVSESVHVCIALLGCLFLCYYAWKESCSAML